VKHRLTIGCLALLCAFTGASFAQQSPRFPQLKPEQLTPEQKAYADDIAKEPRKANYNNPPYNVYLRNPEFGARATAVTDYLRWNTALPARLSEFTILIAARQTSSDYEWYVHYPLAIKAGLDPKIAAALAQNKTPDGMKDDEAAIYDLAMEIDRDKKLSDATYHKTVAKFGERGVIDIVGIIGYYHFVSIILIAGDAVPGPGDMPKLQPLAK
jgi:4-carboxymuconolactone decarboxylase